MTDFVELTARAKAFQSEINQTLGPPAEGRLSSADIAVSRSLVRKTRGYIETVTNQINGTYENGWYDACAVMLRRLLETLIIEAFEYKRIDDKIKSPSGEFFHLKDLINVTLNEPSWNLSRNCKRAMERLKDIGDKSAHNRRFNAHKNDIEPYLAAIRDVIQELLALANLK